MKKIFDITEYGAVADSGASQTQAIQSAIDRCAESGGGEVIVPAGAYLIEGIRLYSDVTLHLLSGARLYGSEDCTAYVNHHVPTTLAYVNDPEWIRRWHLPADHYTNALITCIEGENVAIIGDEGSVIDGVDCFDATGEESFRGPMGICMCRCRNITLRGYTVVRSANWAHQIDGSENILIEGVTVFEGHDGIDVHHCRNVIIRDCKIITGDDCVAGYDVTNLEVTRCELNTSCNTFRIGATNMRVTECDFIGEGKYPHRVSGRHNTLMAFEYYSHAADPVQKKNSNWLIEDCRFRNIDMLMNYDFPSEWHLQETKPLTDVTFRNCEFAQIKNSAVFKAAQEPAELRLIGCTLTDCAEPFIETNENTKVICQ